jgi:hypothetical protein
LNSIFEKVREYYWQNKKPTVERSSFMKKETVKPVFIKPEILKHKGEK